jgi:hypothetical protein
MVEEREGDSMGLWKYKEKWRVGEVKVKKGPTEVGPCGGFKIFEL